MAIEWLWTKWCLLSICPLAICCRIPFLQEAKRHICAIETMLDGHLLDQWILAGNHPNTSCYMEKSSPGDSKWPFHLLVRGHLAIEKGHLTIPKRSQRIARAWIFSWCCQFVTLIFMFFFCFWGFFRSTFRIFISQMLDLRLRRKPAPKSPTTVSVVEMFLHHWNCFSKWKKSRPSNVKTHTTKMSGDYIYTHEN